MKRQGQLRGKSKKKRTAKLPSVCGQQLFLHMGKKQQHLALEKTAAAETGSSIDDGICGELTDEEDSLEPLPAPKKKKNTGSKLTQRQLLWRELD